MMQTLSPSISLMNIYDFFCVDACKIADQSGKLLFRDQSHLTISGAVWLATKIKQHYPTLVGPESDTPLTKPTEK